MKPPSTSPGTPQFLLFQPGEKIRCVEQSERLKRGGIYTVIESPMATGLIAVREVPGLLFHPDRFVRASAP